MQHLHASVTMGAGALELFSKPLEAADIMRWFIAESKKATM
jgi:hypothetical protein